MEPLTAIAFGVLTGLGIAQIFQLRKISMDEQTLSDKLDGLASDLNSKLSDISTEIATLKAAGGATPEQLDALGAKVEAIDAAVKGFATT